MVLIPLAVMLQLLIVRIICSLLVDAFIEMLI
jgi:hypothetical protein